MLELGNIVAGDSILDFDFNTHTALGKPITLAGTPVIKVYKGKATETETTKGVTLTIDHDGIIGKHHVRIVTSDGFYTIANDYSVVLTAGTVDGQSVAGTVLAHFSVLNRAGDVQQIIEVTRSVPTATGLAAPVYNIGSVVYLRDSALLGFLEAYVVQEIKYADGAYQYTVHTSLRGGAPYPTLGDRNIGVQLKTLIIPESNLVTYCEAVRLAIICVRGQLQVLEAAAAARCLQGSSE
jgi:hypothetical protein